VGNTNGEVAAGLRVLAADEDQDALRRTAVVLDTLGHEVIASAVDLAEATEAIAREDPDVSVVLVHDDDEHALGLIEQINEFASGPVVALIAQEQPDFLRRAAERGIDAYARGLDAEALQGALEIALQRHGDRTRLETKVEQLETALERRAIIERAKGIIMERHGIGEREAFDMIRAHARANSRPVVEVARAVSDGHALLRSGGE
jgi:response regulator NasT